MAGLSGLGERIRQSVMSAQGQAQGIPGVGASPGVAPTDMSGLGADIMSRVRQMTGGLGQQGMPQIPQQPTMSAAPTTGGAPAASMPLAAPTSGTTAPSSDSANAVAGLIVQQETGGQNLVGQTASLRGDTLALDSGIFKTTADSFGLDFNRIVNDQDYANQAVATLMTSYATDDASKWNGPAGQSVWEYGEQNLPGGGWEAVARVYFGGDVTGQFVDEQQRSGVTYGQQFVEKMQAAGIPTGPGTPAPGTAPVGPPTTSGTQVLPTNGTGAPQTNPNLSAVVTGAGTTWTPATPLDAQAAQLDQTGTAGSDTEGLVVGGNSPSAPSTGGGYILDDTYQSVGGQPRAVMSPESTSYMEGLFPGASQSALSGNYGFGAKSGCVNADGTSCYSKYINWDPDQHTGIDIATNGGESSGKFSNLVSGTVICYGSQTGSANPGNNTACGSYPDWSPGGGVDGTGSGNLSILTADKAMVTYGHTDISYAQLDGQVTKGTPLGMSGTMNGYHVHLEVRLPIGQGGQYVLVDPDLYFDGYYCGQGYCPS
jgi:hypothetical protein